MPFVRVRAPNAVQYRDVCTGVTGAIGTSYSVLLFDRSVGWRWDVVPRSIVLLVSGLLLILRAFVATSKCVAYCLHNVQGRLKVTSEPIFTLTPIGSVESPLTDLSAAPKQGTEGAPAAWLVFEPAFQDGLRDLQIGDEVLVLTWLDRATGMCFKSIHATT